MDMQQIQSLIQEYGLWIYAILFCIIFAETGLVVAPFLPGDSLLFVVGMLCAPDMGVLELEVSLPLLIVAAFLGDNTNYWIGRQIGGRLMNRPNSRFFKREYVDKTRVFYEKHGGKTVLFARFLPIIRTFAPFVAGIAKMRYQLFLLFSAVGGVVWIGTLILAGYFFGGIPLIRDNLIFVIFGIILITFIPALREFVRHWRRRKDAAQPPE